MKFYIFLLLASGLNAFSYNGILTTKDIEDNIVVAPQVEAYIKYADGSESDHKFSDNEGKFEIIATSVIPENYVATEFKLENPAPNPAKKKVKASFGIETKGKIQLNFYNILGQNIGSKSQTLEQGSYSLPIDVSSLSSGIYFYSLSNNGELLGTKKFTVINGNTTNGKVNIGDYTSQSMQRNTNTRISKPTTNTNVDSLIIQGNTNAKYYTERIAKTLSNFVNGDTIDLTRIIRSSQINIEKLSGTTIIEPWVYEIGVIRAEPDDTSNITRIEQIEGEELTNTSNDTTKLNLFPNTGGPYKFEITYTSAFGNDSKEVLEMNPESIMQTVKLVHFWKTYPDSLPQIGKDDPFEGIAVWYKLKGNNTDTIFTNTLGEATIELPTTTEPEDSLNVENIFDTRFIPYQISMTEVTQNSTKNENNHTIELQGIQDPLKLGYWTEMHYPEIFGTVYEHQWIYRDLAQKLGDHTKAFRTTLWWWASWGDIYTATLHTEIPYYCQNYVGGDSTKKYWNQTIEDSVTIYLKHRDMFKQGLTEMNEMIDSVAGIGKQSNLRFAWTDDSTHAANYGLTFNFETNLYKTETHKMIDFNTWIGYIKSTKIFWSKGSSVINGIVSKEVMRIVYHEGQRARGMNGSGWDWWENSSSGKVSVKEHEKLALYFQENYKRQDVKWFRNYQHRFIRDGWEQPTITPKTTNKIVNDYYQNNNKENLIKQIKWQQEFNKNRKPFN